MLTLLRTDSGNEDFMELVALLDQYLAEVDGEEHTFYNQFNKVQNLNHVVVAYENNTLVGCGAIKEFSATVMEVKRMYTIPAGRGKGIATMILVELEKWAAELSYTKCVLETGKKQVEAIKLYKKSGYRIIANYGQYAGIENSVCFEKELY